MKTFVDDIVVPFDELVDTLVTALIVPNDITNYWLLSVVPLAIACLILLVIIIVKYCTKYRLTGEVRSENWI